MGIDEAGRGPLAGPIAVAAIIVNEKRKVQNAELLNGIRDSKKLSAKQREEWFKIIKKNFKCAVCMIGSQTIDKIGISKTAKLAVARVLRKFPKKPDLVLMDGLLFAPRYYNQKTIIKGDEKVPLIAAASIVAKVCRDRKMRRLHKICPNYCFDIHKGYGTKLHYAMIKKSGFSYYHRRSFLKNVSVSKTSKN